jgi:hypothetical protein
MFVSDLRMITNKNKFSFFEKRGCRRGEKFLNFILFFKVSVRGVVDSTADRQRLKNMRLITFTT